jgi:hypothetical protein
MGVREERIIRNEALFRELNERVLEIEETLTAVGVAEPTDYRECFCECGLENCTAKIHLTRDEYERVRSNPLHFAIVPGHEIAGIERVVGTNDRYVTVEKLEGERELILSDPRR